MSKRCPECLKNNEDSRTFCAFCGATLDPHLRLIQDLERQQDTPSKQEPEAKRGDLNFYVPRTPQEEKKSSPVPWIILVLAVVAVAAWFFLK